MNHFKGFQPFPVPQDRDHDHHLHNRDNVHVHRRAGVVHPGHIHMHRSNATLLQRPALARDGRVIAAGDHYAVVNHHRLVLG